eukprot:CAMPEP_0118990318 /NCGR_PEP_ID=MMETSP1173-20130426/49695_1 /TAXON_ID=1034831 /ORGANISM="Rhizochromulina marina cf, Strain CCMP1243" /LENGTH=114 /DNA_ID=CAMNT_0006941367 /DNA_START=27 /DNA_END=372 /DNA_ORIENTATION=+
MRVIQLSQPEPEPSTPIAASRIHKSLEVFGFSSARAKVIVAGVGGQVLGPWVPRANGLCLAVKRAPNLPLSDQEEQKVVEADARVKHGSNALDDFDCARHSDKATLEPDLMVPC